MNVDVSFLKILVVDDDHVVRDFLIRFFYLQKIQATAAAGGLQAIELLQKNRFDAVLIDIKMPVMDGIEACRRLRAIQPDIECILMTGYIIDGLEEEIARENLHTVIRKPFEIIEIMAEIERIGAKLNQV